MSDAQPPYPQQPPPHQQPQQYPPQQPYPPQPPPPGFPNSPGGYGAPPPGASAAQVDKSAIRPKARWYWIGGGIIVLATAGAILLGVLGVLGISDKIDDFDRVSPGSDTVSIESTGEYVIYSESGSFFVDVEIVSPDGEPVLTSRYLTDLNYSLGGNSGQAVATFDAEDTGQYTITTDSDVAIGTSLAGDLVRTILFPFLVAGLGFLVGLIVIIVTAVKRSGSKKRLAYPG